MLEGMWEKRKKNKKREKELGPWRSKKKRRRTKDSPCPKKMERGGSWKGVHTPSTKTIHPHTCTSWSRFM